MPLNIPVLVKSVVAQKYGVPVDYIADDTVLGDRFQSIGIEVCRQSGSSLAPFNEDETVGSFVSRVKSEMYA